MRYSLTITPRHRYQFLTELSDVRKPPSPHSLTSDEQENNDRDDPLIPDKDFDEIDNTTFYFNFNRTEKKELLP